MLFDGMPFDANGYVSTVMIVDWINWMSFWVNEFEVGVNDSIFSGNGQQKVYLNYRYSNIFLEMENEKESRLMFLTF